MALVTLSVLFLFRLRTSAGCCYSFCSRRRPSSRSSSAPQCGRSWNATASGPQLATCSSSAPAIAPGHSRRSWTTPRARPAGDRVPRFGRRRGTDRPEVLGSVDNLEGVLHARIVDEVAICLPFSQWGHRRHRKPVRGGGQDRPDAHGRDGPRDCAGRVEDLDGTPVFSLVSGRTGRWHWRPSAASTSSGRSWAGPAVTGVRGDCAGRRCLTTAGPSSSASPASASTAGRSRL